MFRPVAAIIMSLSFDTLKSTLCSCVLAFLMRRSQHHGLFQIKFEKLAFLVGFIRIYHDTRSSECQIRKRDVSVGILHDCNALEY